VVGVYLGQVYLLHIGQQGLVISSGIGPCFSLAKGFCKSYASAGRKITNAAPTTLRAIQAIKQFFFGSNNSKSVFIAVNASLRWLNNVVGVYLGQVSLLHIGQQGLVDFFRYRPLLPIG
jgi:hypothetical protein